MRKSVLIAAFLLIALLTMIGCGTPKETAPAAPEEPKKPVVVRLEGGDWGYPNPFTHYSRGPGVNKMRLIFDSLLERDERGDIPWLAESWSILDGGRRYVFQLRKGVKWQDGKPFTARDVAFTLNYYRKHPPVSVPSGASFQPDYLLSINVLSEHQVELVVAEPNANFLQAIGRLSIIPEHIWKDVAEPAKFTDPQSVIGTGPFRLTDYSKEHGSYRYEANREFWGPKVLVDVLEFVPTSDPVLALEKGDIDLAGVPSDVLDRFRKDPSFVLMENPGFWGYRLRFNMQRVEEFKDRQLRRAFAYAINRQDLVDKIARGAGVVGSMGILPPQHRWYNPNLPQYEYDPKKAEELLKGLGPSVKRSYELLVGSGAEVRIGELLKEHLSQVGIELRVVSADTKSRDARIAEGKYEIVLVGHGGWGGDPDYLRTRFSSRVGDWFNGTPGYDNPELTLLLEKQIKETDENKRKELVFRIQHLLAEDVPEIPLYMTTGYTVFRREKYDGWMHVYDHHAPTHNKLSYLERKK
ncbi:MAG: ABC transporter substrate-binding protein [Bacillota bacterium]